MKKLVYLVSLLVFISCHNNIDQDKAAVVTALNKSAEDWSSGNIQAYMDVYWKSEKLQFIGANGINYGWQKTLDNYKTKYPTKDHTGKLTFEVLNITFLAKDLYSLTGKYFLERKVGPADGIFTLIFKKISNKWVIISDHSQ